MGLLALSGSVKMTLPSHRYYQPPNLGGVKYRAEGMFGNQ